MNAYIVSAVRTPIGKFLGEFADIPAPRLGAVAVAEALQRAQIAAEAIDEVVMGHVVQAGVGQAPARQAALFAGLPNTIAAYTVNKVCGSGLKAAMLAAQSLQAGDANVVIAGGMESMSNAPFLLPGIRKGYKYGDQKTVDALIRDGLWCAFEDWPMGEAAEHTARTCNIARCEQDHFAAQSHQRAAAAWERGDFQDEIVSVNRTALSTGRGKGSEQIVSRDEGIRAETTAESLAKLRPAFKLDGSVTAGNASQLSDGAAALVIASESAVRQHQMKPLARIISYATSGVAPKEIFLAPVTAIRKAVEKAKLTLAEIDLFELNEAFASQMLACGRELGLDGAKVNVNGGAIALGHPIGASGARVLTTLVHALQRRKLSRGLASLCLGGGNAVAMVVERM